MKPPFKIKFRILFLLLAVCQLSTYCTKKLHPELTEHSNTPGNNHSGGNITDINDSVSAEKYSGIESNSKRKLQELKDSSIIKAIDTTLLADKIISTAMEYLGIPHCMGGITTRCLDCSGFVMIVFDSYGIELPHNAQEQSKHGSMIKEKKELVRGDIVFFHGSYKTNRYITHSGIYIGDDMFIHTSVGKGVTITSLDDSWWKNKFAFGTRILE
ncbi:MAG: C40 family peptidase [Chloroflexota bacterium]